MSQPPTPRGPLGQLLEDAKLASGKQWRTIESESRIPLSSIQAWISGRSGEPSLRGLLHLARYLNIPPSELVEAALEGYVPPLASGEGSSPSGETQPARPLESGDLAAARARGRGGRRQRPRHKPPSPTPDE